MVSGVLPKASRNTRASTSRAASCSAAESAITRRRPISERPGDERARGEEVAGEGPGGAHVHVLAGAEVHREEQPRLLPRVEVRSRRLPVDPAGPAVLVGAV